MIVQGSTNPGFTIGLNGLAGNLGIAGAALFTGLLVRFVGWRAAFAVPGVNPPAGLGLTLPGRRPKIRARHPLRERRTPQQSRPRTPDPSRCFRGDLGARPTQGLPPALADPSVPYAVP
jgi:MFS family permease